MDDDVQDKIAAAASTDHVAGLADKINLEGASKTFHVRGQVIRALQP